MPAPIEVDAKEGRDNRAGSLFQNVAPSQESSSKKPRVPEQTCSICIEDLKCPGSVGARPTKGRLDNVDSHVTSKFDLSLDLVEPLNERQRGQGDGIKQLKKALDDQDRKRGEQDKESSVFFDALQALEKAGEAKIWSAMDRGPTIIIGPGPHTENGSAIPEESCPEHRDQ